MNRKVDFLTAVRILAPGDTVTLDAATRVDEENLPLKPGAAALEFVVAMQRRRACLLPAASNYTLLKKTHSSERILIFRAKLSLQHAIAIKSAEFWLKLGQPVQALALLQRLPQRVQKLDWPRDVRCNAIAALKSSAETVAQV